MPIDEIIFADTGTELPETYEVVEKFKKIAVIDRVVFSTVKRDLSDNLYSYYWDKKCVPSRMREGIVHSQIQNKSHEEMQKQIWQRRNLHPIHRNSLGGIS